MSRLSSKEFKLTTSHYSFSAIRNGTLLFFRCMVNKEYDYKEMLVAFVGFVASCLDATQMEPNKTPSKAYRRFAIKGKPKEELYFTVYLPYYSKEALFDSVLECFDNYFRQTN